MSRIRLCDRDRVGTGGRAGGIQGRSWNKEKVEAE